MTNHSVPEDVVAAQFRGIAIFFAPTEEKLQVFAPRVTTPALLPLPRATHCAQASFEETGAWQSYDAWPFWETCGLCYPIPETVRSHAASA